MERDAETIFKNAGSKLTGTGSFVRSRFLQALRLPLCPGSKSTATGRAVARGAAWSKRSSIVLGTRIPGFGIGPQRFRQFIPTHRGGIKKLLQKIQGSGVDAQPFLPGRGF